MVSIRLSLHFFVSAGSGRTGPIIASNVPQAVELSTRAECSEGTGRGLSQAAAATQAKVASNGPRVTVAADTLRSGTLRGPNEPDRGLSGRSTRGLKHRRWILTTLVSLTTRCAQDGRVPFSRDSAALRSALDVRNLVVVEPSAVPGSQEQIDA